MTFSVENTDFSVLIMHSSQIEEWTPYLLNNGIRRPLILDTGGSRRLMSNSESPEEPPLLKAPDTPDDNGFSTFFCKVNHNTTSPAFNNGRYRGRVPADIITPIRLTRLDNGVYTPYGKEVNEFFSSDTDIHLLSDVDNPTITCPVNNTAQLRASNTLSVDLIRLISTRQSPYARTNRYADFLESPVIIDTPGSFSLLGGIADLQERFLRLSTAQKIPTIKINNLYRGGSDGAATAEKISETRPQKVVKGGHIFRYKTDLQIVDHETLDWKSIQVYHLGLFESPEKVLKYKRSRAFIPELVASIATNDGIRFFKPDEWETYMRDMYGSHVRYWDGIRKIFPKGLPANSTVINNIITQEQIKPEHFTYVTYASQIETLPEVVKYKKLSTHMDSINSKTNATTRSIETHQRDISNSTTRLEEYKAYIRDTEQRIENARATIQNSTIEREGLNEAREAISQELNAQKEVYENLISGKALPDNILSQATTWISNLANSGIIINDIVYYDVCNDKRISLSKSPEVGITSKLTKDFTLESICFMTTKPLIINVDLGRTGENCKKIVGGPYIVKIGRSNLTVKLATSTACFGIDNKADCIWVHPHTPQITINRTARDSWNSFKAVLTQEVSACLGEASPGLYKAFQTNDPKMAVFAAMTWLTNANSSDAWGKNYKFFPNLADVCLQGNHSLDKPIDSEPTMDELLCTQDGMDTIIENMLTSMSNVEPNLVADINEYLESAPPINFSGGVMFLNYTDIVPTEREGHPIEITILGHDNYPDRTIELTPETIEPIGFTVPEIRNWLIANIDAWDPAHFVEESSMRNPVEQSVQRAYEAIYYSYTGSFPWALINDPIVVYQDNGLTDELWGEERKSHPDTCRGLLQIIRIELGIQEIIEEPTEDQNRTSAYTPYQAPINR